MLDPIGEAYVTAIVTVAERDVSIARVLREIVALDSAVRGGALDLVGAHLKTRTGDADVFACLEALRRDDVAQRLAERLGPPG
jgi:DNA-binding FrmR family transcriptional regulator